MQTCLHSDLIYCEHDVTGGDDNVVNSFVCVFISIYAKSYDATSKKRNDIQLVLSSE